MLHAQQQHSFSPLDLNILSLLTADAGPSTGSPPTHAHPHPPQASKSKQSDRRPPVDPLMVAAAASAGPDITRNHYLHEFFPHKLAYASCDDERPTIPSAPRPKMQSQQAPRRVRLATEAEERRQQEQKQAKLDAGLAEPFSSGTAAVAIPGASSNLIASPEPATAQVSSPPSASARRLSVSNPDTIKLLRQPVASPPTSPTRTAIPLSPTTVPASLAAAAPSSAPSSLPPLVVKCEVRTRIPTPHGHIFLHLYSNNHDSKEHLAFVADQAQMDAVLPADVGTPSLPFLRSTSLDSEWRQGETEMERIVRGAYVGRLSASTIHPSTSPSSSNAPLPPTSTSPEPPLVRIHSECFTGEVIGSQRCDCGEQLDEAFRLITLHQRGVVVYLRQEGRGIGLLEKMRAYNLQDLGHDTVTANLMLGHGADMRTYDIAGAILRDLKVGEVRLLTNNPDKIEQIEKERVKVVERVAMVPRSWIPSNRTTTGGKKRKGGRRPRMSGAALLQQGLDSMASSMVSSVLPSSDDSYSEDDVSYTDDSEAEDDDSYSSDSDASHNLRRSGVGMIGASVTRSAELEKYLRTKIERMGHMLEAPTTPIDTASAPASRSGSPAPSSTTSAPKRHRKHKMSRTASSASAPAGKPHPLASSVVSVAAEEECGSGCEECKE
ncbi:GTP cyclohydrolase II-domain-containing protein [Leucosporidium creatinivorum]|uniref:GTP cyclohydrolase II n=1 Tax=Leucosporidium creatinivorum TaxID=106004 RepID=A0A1Y2G0X3_9BASI|nr:GTP cyclohydrolase II-domain-containing protein [Leucosporidium creatinivorum]